MNAIVCRSNPIVDCFFRWLTSRGFLIFGTVVLSFLWVGAVGFAADVTSPDGEDVGQVDGKTWAWSVARPPGDENAWEIRWGDRLVTTYHNDLDGTPGFFPLQTPRQLELTRRFPIGTARAFEKEDHDHHRSMWLTHGLVNDLDFWIDDDRPHVGKVVHANGEIQILENGIVLSSENDWLDAAGKTVLSDQRRFQFSHLRGDTIIDVTVRFKATNGDITFGDTKEGTFGVRVAGTMKVDAKKMNPKLGGQVINAEGLKDAAAWSQKSDWVDYSGPVLPKDMINGPQPKPNKQLRSERLKLTEPLEQAGITMMYHPGSDLPECRWHVRTYGLFAANPFGRRHFGLDAYDGVTVKNGDSLSLNFRMVLHDGAFDESKTKRHYLDFSSSPAMRIGE